MSVSGFYNYFIVDRMLYLKARTCIINIRIIQHIRLRNADLIEMLGFADGLQAGRGSQPDCMNEVDILGVRRGHL